MVSPSVASATTTTFPAGNVVVTAQYSGDVNFTQSASPPILVLSILPASTTLSVAAAGSVTDTINLSAVTGFTGALQLSCTGLPADSTCSFSPASTAFTGTNTTASTMLTIQTGVTVARAVTPRPSSGSGSRIALASLLSAGTSSVQVVAAASNGFTESTTVTLTVQ